MDTVVRKALLEINCSISSASALLAQLSELYPNDYHPLCELYVISSSKDASKNESVPFLVALATQVKLVIDQHSQDVSRRTHSTHASTTKVTFRVSPSTLGLFFKNNCCPRYLHTACSVYSNNNGRLQVPEFMRLITLKGLLLEKGFSWEKDLEILLRDPKSPTCMLMRDKNLVWWSNERSPIVSASSASSASNTGSASVYKIKSLNKDTDGNTLELKEHMRVSLRAVCDAPAGTALLQSRFEVPQLMLDDLRRGGTYDSTIVAFSTFLPDVLFIERDPMAPNNPNKRVIVVVDAKASAKVAISHKIQATFYAMVLEYVIQDLNLHSTLRVAENAGIWRPETCAPETFSVRHVEPQLLRFLRHDMCTILNQSCTIDDKMSHPDWIYSSKCEHCVEYCRDETTQDKTLSMLPKLNKKQRDALSNLILSEGADKGEGGTKRKQNISQIEQLHNSVLSRTNQPYSIETSRLIGPPLRCNFSLSGHMVAHDCNGLRINKFSPTLDLVMSQISTQQQIETKRGTRIETKMRPPRTPLNSLRVLCGRPSTSLPNRASIAQVVHLTIQKDYASNLMFGYSIQVRGGNRGATRFKNSESSVGVLSCQVLWGGDGNKPSGPNKGGRAETTHEYQEFLLEFAQKLAAIVTKYSPNSFRDDSGSSTETSTFFKRPICRVLFVTLTGAEKRYIKQVLRDAVMSSKPGEQLHDAATICIHALSVDDPSDVNLVQHKSMGFVPAPNEREEDNSIHNGGESKAVSASVPLATKTQLPEYACHDQPRFVAIDEEASKCFALPVPSMYNVKDIIRYVCAAGQQVRSELHGSGDIDAALHASVCIYEEELTEEHIVRDWRLSNHLRNGVWKNMKRVERLLLRKAQAADVTLNDVFDVLEHHFDTHHGGTPIDHYLPRMCAPLFTSSADIACESATKSNKTELNGCISLSHPVISRLDFFTQKEGMSAFHAHQQERRTSLFHRVNKLGGDKPTAIVLTVESLCCEIKTTPNKRGGAAWDNKTYTATLRAVSGDVSRVTKSDFGARGEWMLTKTGKDYKTVSQLYNGELDIHIEDMLQSKGQRSKNPNWVAQHAINHGVGEYCYVDVMTKDANSDGILNIKCEPKTKFTTFNWDALGTWTTKKLKPSTTLRKSAGTKQSSTCNLFQNIEIVIQPRFNDVGSKQLCHYLHRLDHQWKKRQLENPESPLPIFLQLNEEMAALNESRHFDDESETMTSDFEMHCNELKQLVPMTTSQSEIFQSVLSRHVQGVWGPPGSGKTYFSAATIVRMMILKQKRGEQFRVAITAQTNLAIHHLLMKINELRKKAGVEDTFVIGSMNSTYKDDKSGIVSARKSNSAHPTRNSKNFFEEDRLVVGTTCLTAVGKLSKFNVEGSFDVLIVDEASQLRQNELAAGISLLKPESAWRLIVVGDQLQMPPIVKNKYPQTLDNGSRPGVHVSVLDFIRFNSGERGTSIMLLKENHRMNEQLSEFTRTTLSYHDYKMCSQLGCTCRTRKESTYPVPDIMHSGSSGTHTLTPQECAKIAIRGSSAVVCVEIALSEDSVRSDGAAARGEAELVAHIIQEYRARPGVHPDATPFVVTPHHYQRLAVCRALNIHPDAKNPPVIVSTVEKIQGNETDLVIGCYGFTNQNTIVNELDFVYDRHRLNVTATRAKERFVLIVSKEIMDDSLTEVMESEVTSEGWLLFQDVQKFASNHSSALVCEIEVTAEPMLPGPSAVRQTSKKSSKNSRSKSSSQGESKNAEPVFQKMGLSGLDARIAERVGQNMNANVKNKNARTSSDQCQGILKSGKNRGNQCQNKAKYESFCGIHKSHK